MLIEKLRDELRAKLSAKSVNAVVDHGCGNLQAGGSA